MVPPPPTAETSTPAQPEQRERTIEPDVVVGASHACHLRADGALFCWGGNDAGQIGDGSRDVRSRPVRIALEDVVKIVATEDATCAVKRDGSVWCWGQHDTAWAGERVRPTLVESAPKAVDVSLARFRLCVLDPTRTLHCTGFNKPELEKVLTGVTTIDGRWNRTCARTSAGALWCMGIGGEPKRIDALPEVGHFAAGSKGGCSASADGRLTTCWGEPAGREDGTLRTMDIPQPHHMDVGAEKVCAATADAVWCWREQDRRDSRREPTLDPRRVAGLTDVARVAVGHGTTCALKRDASVLCWGNGYFGATGQGTKGWFTVPVRVPSLPAMRDVALAEREACGVGRDGRVFCWGGGQTDGKPRAELREQKLQKIVRIHAKLDELCALTEDGVVTCREAKPDAPWRRVAKGIVALGPGMVQIHDLDRGAWFAVHTDGRLSRWWTNFESANQKLVPVHGLRDVTAAAGTMEIACVVHRDRTVSCWPPETAKEQGGRLRLQRTRVEGVDDAVALSGRCVLRAGGEVGCVKPVGRRGFGKPFNTLRLEPVDGRSGSAILGRERGICIIEREGGVRCSHIQYKEHAIPRQRLAARLEEVQRLGFMSGNACAVNTKGEVWCVGSNVYGVMGQRDPLWTAKPTMVTFD